MNDQQLLEGYRRRIVADAPQLENAAVKFIGEGLVNNIVVVDDRLVFRFPKTEWARDLMRQEAKCLALARRSVEMRLPIWQEHDGQYISYVLIEGIPLQQYHLMNLNPVAMEGLAAQIGCFLQQMHSIPLAEARAMKIGSSDTNRSADDWLRLYEDVQTELFPHMMAYACDWVHNLFAALQEDPHFMDYEPSFMNGDLANYHLLFNTETQLLNGVIDFGTAGIGDPATDISVLLNQYGRRFVNRLAPYYPGLEALIGRARFWAQAMELGWALHGLRDNDPSWFLVNLGKARNLD